MAPAKTKASYGAISDYSLPSLVSYVDKYLSEYTIINQITSTLNIRPYMVPLGICAMASLVIGIFDNLITNMVGFCYPAWQSFKAIETPSPNDDRQWLTYWVVFAIFTIAERFGDVVLFWVPFYYLMKLTVLLWLSLPRFQGASIVYVWVRPFLTRYEDTVDRTLENLGIGCSKKEDSKTG